EGLGRAVPEVCTSRSCRRDLTHLNRRRAGRWSRRRCRCCRSRSSSCRGKCSCSCRSGRRRKCCCRRKRRGRCKCRCRRGNVAVSERGALEYAARDVVEETGNIVSAIELHQSGAIACLARNQDVATQPCEVGRKILVEPYRSKVIECYRLEKLAARAEGARSLRDDKDGFPTVPLDDI